MKHTLILYLSLSCVFTLVLHATTETPKAALSSGDTLRQKIDRQLKSIREQAKKLAATDTFKLVTKTTALAATAYCLCYSSIGFYTSCKALLTKPKWLNNNADKARLNRDKATAQREIWFQSIALPAFAYMAKTLIKDIPGHWRNVFPQKEDQNF